MAQSGGILGVVLPIEGGRACYYIRVRQYRRIVVGPKIRARLKQQDLASLISAHSRGKDCPRRSATYNNHVKRGAVWIGLAPSFHGIFLFALPAGNQNALMQDKSKPDYSVSQGGGYLIGSSPDDVAHQF